MEVFREKIVPIHTVVEQIKTATMIMEKIVERTITVPKIIDVERIREITVEVPKIVEI